MLTSFLSSCPPSPTHYRAVTLSLSMVALGAKHSPTSEPWDMLQLSVTGQLPSPRLLLEPSTFLLNLSSVCFTQRHSEEGAPTLPPTS